MSCKHSLVWVNWKIAPRVMDCRIFLLFWITFIHTISNRVDICILSRIIQRFIAIVLTHILQYNITVKIAMTTAVLVGPFDHKVWLSTWFWLIFTAAHKVFLQKRQKLNLQIWLTLITSFCKCCEWSKVANYECPLLKQGKPKLNEGLLDICGG